MTLRETLISVWQQSLADGQEEVGLGRESCPVTVFRKKLRSVEFNCGGLRIIDVADPLSPKEVGWFIPEPAGGRPAPQSNDVTLDDRGLIYLVDRNVGFDILEQTAG